jgi:hypothetical protein
LSQTADDKHKRLNSMPSAGFELADPTIETSQDDAFNLTGTEIGDYL